MGKTVLSYTFYLSIPFVLIFLLQEISSLPTLIKADSTPQLSAEKRANIPQWEDLGWAWGKRAEIPKPQWEDLGWSWGKRSLKGTEMKPDWNDLGWTWG